MRRTPRLPCPHRARGYSSLVKTLTLASCFWLGFYQISLMDESERRRQRRLQGDAGLFKLAYKNPELVSLRQRRRWILARESSLGAKP